MGLGGEEREFRQRLGCEAGSAGVETSGMDEMRSGLAFTPTLSHGRRGPLSRAEAVGGRGRGGRRRRRGLRMGEHAACSRGVPTSHFVRPLNKGRGGWWDYG